MFMFTGKAYDLIKHLVQVVLPAIGALYFGLAQIWGLPASEQVVGTIAIITTFLGVSLGISHNQYYKSGAAYDGKMVVTEPEEGKKLFSLELDGAPEDIQDKESIRFKVCPDPTQHASHGDHI